MLNAWSQRDFDLSTYAGKTVSDVLLLAEGCTPPGTWDQWYGDMSVVSADGSVENLWNGQSSVSIPGWSPDPGVTGITYDVSTSGTPAGTTAQSLANRTHYYLDDHLGTAQYELSSSGWPLWQGQFDAYGKELADPAGTVFHYKFTGKERDAESGLDYFGARYYGSGMGRWMSADWADKPEAVPYSILTDPQSLNLYSYVRNHPINAVDVDGHASNDQKLAFGCLGEMTNAGNADGGSNCESMRSARGSASDSNMEFNEQQYQNMLARQKNSTTPVQAGEQWLTGTGPRNQVFHDGDPFTEMLRHHSNVQDVIEGVKDGSLPSNGDHDYNLGGLGGVGLYLRDYSTLLTGGASGNLAVTYLGSYSLHYTTSDGVITFTVRNTSTLGSATHLPVFGYTAAGQRLSQFMTSLRRNGPMSPTTQTFIFHENIVP